MLEWGMSDWMVKGYLELFDLFGSGKASDLSPTVKKITGSPPRKLDDFIKDNLEAFSDAGVREKKIKAA
jgi:hypothetical protein